MIRPHISQEPMPITAQRMAEARAKFFKATPLPRTKIIPLTRGKFAIVDEEDFESLKKYNWSAHKDKNTYYAVRHIPIKEDSRRPTISMHRMIANPPSGFVTDHINGDGLDNRRENLRIVTHTQNCQNLHIKKASKFPGVSWFGEVSKWQATIRIFGKKRHLGLFVNEIDAATAYRVASVVLRGEEPVSRQGVEA